jgi:hypothetical protein
MPALPSIANSKSNIADVRAIERLSPASRSNCPSRWLPPKPLRPLHCAALSDREAVADIFPFCNIEHGRQGTIDMNDTTVGFDIAEEDILTYEVSDEAIESAACSLRDKPGSATISFCSGLDSCPS